MRVLFRSILLIGTLCLFSDCSPKRTGDSAPFTQDSLQALKDSLSAIAAEYPGEIGVALITDSGDTLAVNNDAKYPLMSVFKLHQAISLCRDFEKKGASIDSMVRIRRIELNPDTWSPMLKDFPDSVISLSVRDLLRYTLSQSDNNASNWLFQHIESVSSADSCLAAIIPRASFRLSVTEAEMFEDHSLAYRNYSSPLGAALLVDRLFSDSILREDNAVFIRTTLAECKTGSDRIGAPFKDSDSVTVAHKTGSGFRSTAGILSAHNDVARISLPDGRHYTLAVLVKDFHGAEPEAAAVIARISRIAKSSLIDAPEDSDTLH